MPKIEIYTQAWCPFCARALKLLKAKGVQYDEIDAPHGSLERQQSIARSGRTTVPQVFVNGSLVGGSDDLAALEKAGRLDALLAA